MVQQTPQAAHAGPSSLKPPGLSGSSGSGRQSFVSFRDIYDHLELARHQRSPEELETILRSNKDRFKRCASPYAKANDASKGKIAGSSVTLGSGASVELDDQQRDLCSRISERHDLDEVEALVLLRTFLESEDRSLDLLTRPAAEGGGVSRDSVAPGGCRSASTFGASTRGKAGSDDLVSDFLDAFNVFYFEERLYLLRSTCSLFRIAEDASHELYDLACDVLALFADEAFGSACLDDFEAMAAEPLPEQLRDQPRYSSFWAKQTLKEQMGLLEVIFLLLYGRVQASPALVVRILQTFQRTDAGRQQANSGFFDNESIELVTCIGHLLVLIAVESLALEEAMDGIELLPSKAGGSQNKLVEDPAKLGEALDLLEQTGQDPSRSPVLLAWSLVLNRIDDALPALEERFEAKGPQELPAHIVALADTVRTDDGGPPVWRRLAQAAFAPELSLFASMISILSSPLLATSNSTAALAVSAPSALAYRAVFKGLLLSVTELVKPEFLPNFDALVALWEAAFGSGVAVELSPAALEGIAALCVQFWEIDAHYDSRCAAIDTARRRWPVSFRPLMRLVKALTGNAKVDALGSWPSSLYVGARSSSVEQACRSAFQFLAQIPTFAQVLPQGAAALGAPYEAITGGDFGSVSYRVSQAVQVAGTHVRLPAGTTGSTISEIGATPIIVLWTPPTPISAWKLMRDILVGFPPYLSASGRGGSGGDIGDSRVFGEETASVADFRKLAPANAGDLWEEVAAEALELFSSLLSASPKLAWGLLTHLDGDDSALLGSDAINVVRAPAAKAAQAGGRSKDLAAVSIHLLQHALVGSPIHTRLVDAAYKLLSILLPYMPNEIWQTIRSSNVLSGSPGSLSYISLHRAGGGQGRSSTSADGLFSDGSGSTPSVLLAHETSRACYAGLLSLLDFLTALVLEVQRSHFVSAAELLEIKATVLTRGLAWVFESVWLEYQSWRYTKLREKLEIGRRCTVLFHLVLSETSWKVASLPGVHGFDLRGPASGLVEALERALVTSPSMLSVAPLVSALGSGQQLIDQLHRSGRPSDAALAEEYVLTSLQLTRLVVSRRRDLVAARLAQVAASRSAHTGKAPPSHASLCVELGLLERLFFDHAAVATRPVSGGGRKSARVELASAVMSYVLLPISSSLSAEAAKLITAICRSTADMASHGQPVPGLVGHLGTIAELESTMAGLVDLVGNAYLDASLRADVWTMLAAVVDTQPALATLLLTGRHLAKTTEFQLAEADNSKSKDGDATKTLPTVSSSYGQALDRTALEVASDAVLIGEELLRSDPALLESILRFLDTAWTHASEHVAAFEPVRSKAAFFKALGDLATAEADVPPSMPEGFVIEDGARRTDADVEAREYAHRRMSQARALRLLEQDVQIGNGSNKGTSAGLTTLLSLLSDGANLRTALESSFKTSCDPALQYESERKLAELFPTVNLAALRHPARRDDFDAARQYGDNYVFDAAALRRKLEGFYETLSDDDVDDLEALDEGVLMVATINVEWTTLDVQATFLRAWTQSIRSTMGRLIAAAVSSGKIDQLEDALITAWTACAAIAADETLEGDVMRGIHAARVELLSVIVEAAWGRQDAGQRTKGEQIVELSELASRLLSHPTFSVEDSIQGLVKPPFHRGCFDVALFCAVQCRCWLRKQGESAAATGGGAETHRSLHRIMDAFARHTITSLGLSMSNCLLCIQKSQHATDAARALEDDLDLLVSLFELVIRDDVGLLPHSWLAQVQEHRLFQLSIDLLSRAPVLRFDGSRGGGDGTTTSVALPSPSPNSAHHPLFVAPVLSLLLALSSHPASSEQLALAGVVNGLSSNMLTETLETGIVSPLLLSGDRNPTHDAWTMMLRIVVNLIDNLAAPSNGSGSNSGGDGGQWTGTSARFIETDVDGFVRVYGRQVENALAFRAIHTLSSTSAAMRGGFASAGDQDGGPDSIVTLAGLDELDMLARLFYCMVRCLPPSPTTSRRSSSTGALTTHLCTRLAWLLQPLAHLLQHPRELQSLLGLDASSSSTDTRSRTMQDCATSKLVKIVSTLLGGIWYQCSTFSILTRESDSWPGTDSPATLIRPSMRTGVTSTASLGTLLDLAGYLCDRIRQCSPNREGEKDALEKTLAICATQAAIWSTAPPPSTTTTTDATLNGDKKNWKQTARLELDAGLASEVASALRTAKCVVAQGAAEEATALLHVVENFIQARLDR